MFRAGGLSLHYQQWMAIESNQLILSWIKNGVPIPFVSKPEPFISHNRLLSTSEEIFVDNEIKDLLSSGAIQTCENAPLCVSPISCVPKRGGKLRMVIDLRRVNSYVAAPKFRSEDIRTVCSEIQFGDNLITIDLKNGYHHVPVSNEHQTYLGFRWKGVYYSWRVLPSGLSCSAYYFCKLIRPVVEYVRSAGLRTVAYVDDFILMSQPESSNADKTFLIKTLQNLGWHINWEKSSLIPETTKTYLGYVINSIGSQKFPTLHITRQRVLKLRKDIKRTLLCKQVQARALARVAGQCISMTQAIIPGKLLLRSTYRLLATKTSWLDNLILSQPVLSELQWWLEATKSWNVKEIQTRPVDLQMSVDASMSGWGSTLGSVKAAGFWNRRVAYQSSNYRELLAILLALYSYKDRIQNKCIQILSDNISAIAYINRLGGSSEPLSQLATAIWHFAYENGIYLVARHISGHRNIQADYYSRLSNHYEWHLQPALFSHLDLLWGPHDIDRFACMTNTQLPVFNSRFADPLSSGIDALSQQNWGSMNNYVNPPFRMIPQVLQKIRQAKALATVIAPKWPAQTWYQQLLRMSIAPPIPLPNHPHCFIHLGLNPEPLRNRKWKVFAWRVSGRTN